MVDDHWLALYGEEISVREQQHLEVYCGEFKKDEPCKEWYVDPSSDRPKRIGYIAIIQRHSGCLAYIKEQDVQGRGVVGPTPIYPPR